MRILIRFFYVLNDFVNNSYNSLLFKFKKIQYGSFPLIIGRLFIRGGGKIFLGEKIVFISSGLSNAIGGPTRMILNVKKGGHLSIGDFTGISNGAIVCHDRIEIGSYVKIGGNVKIYDTDFHSLDYKMRINKITDIAKTKAVKINDHCFIGAHSIILKGVTIGEKSIVGAGSVVTKNIPDGEIWAGNPAKFIKKL